MVVCVQRVQCQGSVARERCMEGAAMRERILAAGRLGGSKRSWPAWSAWRLIAELKEGGSVVASREWGGRLAGGEQSSAVGAQCGKAAAHSQVPAGSSS